MHREQLHHKYLYSLILWLTFSSVCLSVCLSPLSLHFLFSWVLSILAFTNWLLWHRSGWLSITIQFLFLGFLCITISWSSCAPFPRFIFWSMRAFFSFFFSRFNTFCFPLCLCVITNNSSTRLQTAFDLSHPIYWIYMIITFFPACRTHGKQRYLRDFRSLPPLQAP